VASLTMMAAGYVGMVTDATDTMARLELQTNCKTISVEIDKLRVIGFALISVCS
jgi:transcription elongation factor